jgi:hypothetical protein
MNNITDEEWTRHHIHTLPSEKASGPSLISYEMIKHSSLEMKQQLLLLTNEIIKQEKLPNEYKLANIYPIPKPKPWGCKLVNTQLITLLETARKLMVSILNKRLAKILKDNNILRRYQFAELPENSTFEPIRIINEIIQDANEHNKEFWFLALDISKAYDKVNIYMLEKARAPIGFGNY